LEKKKRKDDPDDTYKEAIVNEEAEVKRPK
jgi:hypothetical protein